MTDEDIFIEYELYLISKGEKKKTCFSCGTVTHRPECPECGKKISGDVLADEIFSRIDAGEDIDLNEVFRVERKPNGTVGMIDYQEE